ncbi:MAG: hypothetical protein ACRDY2_06395 [Acidimicrobiales bacterium]
MSTAYTVSILFEGIELEVDATVEAILTRLPEAVPASVGGHVTVSATIQAHDPEQAALALAQAMVEAVPSAVAVRIDQDLVSISDIAERTRRSRESIRLLAEGARGPGRFPAPVGTVGNAIRVWGWAVVLDWFRETLNQDLGERGVPSEVAAVLDACLALRRSLTGAPTAKQVLSVPCQPGATFKVNLPSVPTSGEPATA